MKALKWVMADEGMDEKVKERFEFSREFGGLQALKSEFAGSKVQNSRENFGGRCLVAVWKG